MYETRFVDVVENHDIKLPREMYVLNFCDFQ